MVAQQQLSDIEHYQAVKQYFYNELMQKYRQGKPYTVLISTQAMSLSALCDAVIEYNQFVKMGNRPAPKVKIHQYMTDLPTKGAVHFFKPLQKLTLEQRRQIYLYAVDFEESVANHFHLMDPPFAGLINIAPENNPLVRLGFRNPMLKQIALDSNITLRVQKSPRGEVTHTIRSDQKIASIMLGSQARGATVDYAKALLANNQHDKIFVFTGNNKQVRRQIEALDDRRLVILNNQDDIHMAPVFVRSETLFISGGGMGILENMAMPHQPDKKIFIHQKQDAKRKLTSGIKWEDANVTKFIEHSSKRGIQAQRTCVKRIDKMLQPVSQAVLRP